MNALVWEAPRQMALRDLPMPAVAPDEVLIKVAYAGICGSELGGYLGHNALRVPPLVMGHEFSGQIVARGDQAVEHNPALAQGQAVTVNPLASCGVCEFCRRGVNQLCVSRRLIGAHRPGAFAEYVAAPAERVIPLPEGMSLRTGALAEPVACGVRVGELAGDVAGKDVLVIGAGPLGLMSLQALRLRGAARAFVADVSPERLAMGADLGGEPLNPRQVDVVQAVRGATGGLGVHVSVDAVGTALTRRQCVEATRSTGAVILGGLHEEVGEMPAAQIIRREIALKGSFAYAPANFVEAVGLLARGAVRLDPWVVEAPLAEGGGWFEQLIASPGHVAKVLLVP